MLIVRHAAHLLFVLLCIRQVGAQPLAIFSINADGTDRQLILADSKRDLGSLDISPDGKQLAFDSWPASAFNPAQQFIHVCDVDGKNMRKLATGAMPKWAPNGKLLAYQDYMHDKGIHVIGPDGTGKERVAEKMGSPHWFANGGGLASLDWGRNNIQFLDLRTGKRVPLRKQDVNRINHGFALSPDDEMVCFVGGIGPGAAIYLAAISGEARPRIVHRGPVCGILHFHPDGKHVVFSEGADRKDSNATYPPAQLFVLHIDSEKVEQIKHTDPNELYLNPAFSPDGKRIYFCSTVR